MGIHKEKKELFGKLQQAVLLELSTIPPYLMALYNFHPGSNADASRIIRSVAMEEMLHMVLAANVLSALGGQVKLRKENIPSYPLDMSFKKEFRNRNFTVNLAKFSEASLDTFLQIEAPEFLLEKDTRSKFSVPGITVGDFYQGIKDDLSDLTKNHSSKEIFTGAKTCQVSEQYYWGAGGKIVVVTDMYSAHRAIDLIVD